MNQPPPGSPCARRAWHALLCAASVLSLAGTARAAGGIDELEALLQRPVYAASKFAQASADAPVAMTVLTSGDILTYGWRTLAEVLNAARGVMLREDRSYSYIGVRGFGRPGDFSQRVLITIDGMRVNDAIYDQALPGREFPLEVGLIERVEFIPGPGSSFYGSNAVVAVVNVVTKSAGDLGAGHVSVGLGSHHARSVSLRQGLSLPTGTLVLGAHIERRPGADLSFPEFVGVARGRDGESDRKLFAKWRAGEWQATGLWSEREKNAPTAYYGTDFDVAAPTRDRYAAADLQWRRSGEVHDLLAHVSLVDYRFDGNYPYGADVSIDAANGRWLVAEGSWVFRGWAAHRLVLGGETQRNLRQQQRSVVVGANPALLLDSHHRSHRIGAFFNDEWTLSAQWRAVFGARWDRQANGKTSFTPRAALFWQPTPELSVKWVEGRAYREPSDYESRYDDALTQVANPALAAEKLVAREWVVDWRPDDGWRLSGSLFRNRFSELIDPLTDPVSGLVQYRNTPGVRTRGVEVEAEYLAAGGWRLRASWAGTRTADAVHQAALPNAPRSLLKLHSSAPLPWPGAVVALEWQRVGERLSLLGATLPAHQVTGLTLRLAPMGRSWSMTAGVSNAFNTRYADPGGPEHSQDLLARDGRRWHCQYTLAF